MSSYQINVSQNGKFLFRTEEQPCGPNNDYTNEMHDLFKQKFPDDEGYTTRMVIWPDRVGTMYY